MNIPKPIAEDLLPIVNDLEDIKALNAYAEYRIDNLYYQLEHAKSLEDVRLIQGAIQELRKLMQLSDIVKAVK